jgi:hypothetical protein
MNYKKSNKILLIDNISSNQSKEIITNFFEINLNKIIVYEVIFENKNLRHLISQFIRFYSLLLSIRMFKFIPPSFANHVGQIFNNDTYWDFSEILPIKNYKNKNFVEFLLNKIQFDNFYGRIYIRPKDIKLENWVPSYPFKYKYSVVKAFLTGVHGLISGIISYKITDPLNFYEKSETIKDNLKPKKKNFIDFNRFILNMLLLPLKFLVAIFRCILSFLIKRFHQICSSVGNVTTGTNLDPINACSRVPTPQDLLLYGNVIRLNSELCVCGYQDKDKFIDKQKKMDYESALILEILNKKNIKIRKIPNIVLNRYLISGAKYPDYLPSKKTKLLKSRYR